MTTLALLVGSAGIAQAQDDSPPDTGPPGPADSEASDPGDPPPPELEAPTYEEAPAATYEGEPAATADPVPEPPAAAEEEEAEEAEEAPAPAPSWTDFIKVRGFGVLWVTPHRGTLHPSSDRETDLFHLRFGRVIVTATPIPELRANVVIGFDHPNVFFNYQLTYTGSEWVNITAGQFRLPFGAAISTPAFRLHNYDRPRYVYVMSKEAIRDLGVAIHSPRGGILDHALEYSFGMFNGEGRIHPGIPALGNRDFQDYLFSGRVVFNPGAWFLPSGGRLALGGSLAHANDPAAGPDMMTARANAPYHLGGRLTSFAQDRSTWLAGGDLTFSAFNIWFQGEMIYMDSVAADGTQTQALGWNVEAGYQLDVIRTLLVARYEWLNRNLSATDMTTMAFSVGGRVRPVDHIFLGAYYLHFEYQPTGMTNYADDNRVRIEMGIEFL